MSSPAPWWSSPSAVVADPPQFQSAINGYYFAAQQQRREIAEPAENSFSTCKASWWPSAVTDVASDRYPAALFTYCWNATGEKSLLSVFILRWLRGFNPVPCRGKTKSNTKFFSSSFLDLACLQHLFQLFCWNAVPPLLEMLMQSWNKAG